MFRRRHINGERGGRYGRFASGVAEAVRWPFERTAWSVERRLLWPLQRRLAGRRRPGHGAGVAALAAIGIAAILTAILVLPGGGEAPGERAEPARVAIAPPAEPQPEAAQAQEPTLHGVPPHFGVGAGVGVAKQGGASPSASGSGSTGTASSGSGEAASSGEEAGATASSAGKPVPAGPAAMKVAHRFAEAFVFYEIGEKPAKAKAAFAETTTEQLAEALDERPPRLPAGGKVPKAKVLNIVPGPRFGGQYTVSVSLLRVGVTSELRITLQEEKDGEWRVAQILG